MVAVPAVRPRSHVPPVRAPPPASQRRPGPLGEGSGNQQLSGTFDGLFFAAPGFAALGFAATWDFNSALSFLAFPRFAAALKLFAPL